MGDVASDVDGPRASSDDRRVSMAVGIRNGRGLNNFAPVRVTGVASPPLSTRGAAVPWRCLRSLDLSGLSRHLCSLFLSLG